MVAPRPHHRRRCSTIALAACLALIAVCGSTGCSTYAHRVTQVRSAYYSNQLSQAEKLVQESLTKGGGEADVLTLEHAMIQLASGRAKEAEQSLRRVRDSFDHLEQTDVAETAWSFFTDDKGRAYAGEDYEKVLIRALLAVTNLMHDGGDAEAYVLQTMEKQEQIIAAGVDKQGENPKAQYQRVAFAPYLRGVLSEASHWNYDDAQRSFAQVVSWRPEFTSGKADVERVTQGRQPRQGYGVIQVFAFTGRGPYKEEAVEAPTSASLLIAGEIVSALGKQTLPPNIAPVKVPKVVARPNSVQGVSVLVDGRAGGETQTVTDVTLLARQQCEALLPRTVARAVARRVVKMGVVYGTKEAAGFAKHDVASFAVDMAGLAWEATESADTRCWGLLPDKIQVLRLEVPAGDHDLKLIPVSSQHHAAGAAASRRIRVRDGGNTYVLAQFPTDQLVGQVLVREQ